jgi:hypothetical protein
MKGDGGIVILGDSGLDLMVLPALLYETALSFVDVVDADTFEPYEVLRESGGCEVDGVMTACSKLDSVDLSKDLSPNLK